MCQGELDERVVDATISVGDVEPSYSQGAFLLPSYEFLYFAVVTPSFDSTHAQ